MSWLAKSIINSLTDNEQENNQNKLPESQQSDDEEEDPTTSRGVKEDINELTETLTRQFRGFASFLAPPPSDLSDPPVDDAAPNLAGIRSDLAEIGGKFRSGIEKISNAKEAVSEISKMATSLLMVGNEDDNDDGFVRNVDGVFGIDDEVVEFVKSVSMRPEIWLDFPLNYDEEEDHDNDEFDMTDAQQEHALAVEGLVPALSSLRIELCPSHMSEGHFWKIYFLLLHARLSKKDAELLITPQIEEARALLLQDMPNTSERGTTPELSVEAVESNSTKDNLHSQLNISTKEYTADDDSSSIPVIEPNATSGYISESKGSDPAEESTVSTSSNLNKDLPTDDAFTSISITDTVETEKRPTETNDDSFTSMPIAGAVETEKKPIQTTEVEVVDKSVIQLNYDNTKDIQNEEEEDDEWLQDEDEVEIEESGDGQRRDIQVVNDEDISFSDLEEDDGDQSVPKNH